MRSIYPSEDQEQIAFIEWVTLYPFLRDVIHHSPNGGSRHAAEAAKFKRMGVKRGFPDLFFYMPLKGYAGLFIEMKSKKGKLSPEQRDVLEQLRKCGYRAEVAYGCQEAIDITKDYFGLG